MWPRYSPTEKEVQGVDMAANMMNKVQASRGLASRGRGRQGGAKGDLSGSGQKEEQAGKGPGCLGWGAGKSL